MLRIRNLEAGYGPLRVLKNVSLHVGEGEIVALVGANGAGKTTLLSTISALLSPMGGEIEFAGDSIIALSAEKIPAKGCVHVPEGREVFAAMSVEENLLLGAKVTRRRKGAKLKHLLEQQYSFFPILAERRYQYAGTLSGGEQQMLAMGRALMAQPKMLMLDEPSTGLAPKIIADIFEKIVQLRAQGNTILLVEQNAKKALEVADRGYVIETGKIILQGPSSDLLRNRDVQRAYLGREYE